MKSSALQPPGTQQLLRAREILRGLVHKTPVHTSKTLDGLVTGLLFFKCENFQKGGAFKFRGASHAINTLSTADASMGVATHSSGNHAQALSLAAKIRGISAHIVMPENAPKIKVRAVEDYGGIITFCKPTLEARETNLKQVIDGCGALEIHPYNDYRIIAGQASAAAELFEQAGKLDCLVAPVGGGGLLSGTILATQAFSPNTKVYGAEPEMANDAWESFRKRKLVPVKDPKTLADGLRTSLGSLTFPIIRDGASDILTVSELQISDAMRMIWERMKIIVEPSAAVPLAAVLANRNLFEGRRTGIIISGGNVDLDHLPWAKSKA